MRRDQRSAPAAINPAGSTRGMATGTVQIAVIGGTTYTAGLFCNNGPGTTGVKCWAYTLNVDVIKR